MKRSLFRLSITAAACTLAGCAAVAPTRVAPLDFNRSPKALPAETVPGAEPAAATSYGRLPSYGRAAAGGTEAARPAAAARAPAEEAAPDANDEVSIAIEQTPLPMFIQILYGSVLKRPYSIDAAVQTRTEPVTFKTSKPISKQRMNELAATLLRSYNLTVQDLDGLVKIGPQTPPGQSGSNTLLQGRQLPARTNDFAQIHHHVQLEAVRTADMTQWLRQVMGQRVTVTEDNARNGFLLSGNAGDIRVALSLVESFDQPRMRGRVAIRITPAYATVADMAQKLVDILATQGISASTTSGTNAAAVVVMPIPSIASLYVFASSQAMLDHVRLWARELDKAPKQNAGAGLFTYPVKYADAQELARTLGELLGGGGGAASTGAASTGGASAPRVTSFGRVVVNNATNTLIIRGTSAEEQQQIKDLLKELDRPTKSAMIEVVVAELQQGLSEELGIDWKASNSALSSTVARSASLGSTGFNLSYVNSARDLLLTINALASKSQARILSNPRVLARNGETATIQVGSEVPVVTSQQTTGTTGGLPIPAPTTGVLQQIQYRSTGVILKVRPVINSGNRLDLDVSQEVSSAAITQTGVSASPTISTRRIETKLSLRDGSTILLGGLISQNGSVSEAGVPLLKDIPGLGSLFKKAGDESSRTELLVMITPHVVNDDFEAEEISAAMRDSFGAWAQDLKLSRVATEPPPVQPPVPNAARTQDEDELPPLLTQPALPPGTANSALGGKPAAAANAADEGVITSRPLTGAQGQAAAATPPAPAASGAEPKPGDKKAPPKPAAADATPPGMKGQQVTDPKVLDDIKKLLERK